MPFPPNGSVCTEPLGNVMPGSMPIVSGAPALAMSMKSVVIPIRPRGSSAKKFTLARAADLTASLVASMISLPLGELNASAIG